MREALASDRVGPVTASIEAGRALVWDIHPSVTVYKRTDTTYVGGL